MHKIEVPSLFMLRFFPFISKQEKKHKNVFVAWNMIANSSYLKKRKLIDQNFLVRQKNTDLPQIPHPSSALLPSPSAPSSLRSSPFPPPLHSLILLLFSPYPYFPQ